MRSFLLLTETGPVLLLTRCSSITESGLVDLLSGRGIKKFIAFEVPVSKVHTLYGVPFEVVAADIDRGLDMRILDYNRVVRDLNGLTPAELLLRIGEKFIVKPSRDAAGVCSKACLCGGRGRGLPTTGGFDMGTPSVMPGVLRRGSPSPRPG